MKKTLIALAVLAASGASFAQVTLYGAVSTAYKSQKSTAITGVDTRADGISSGEAIGADRWGMSGTEDLGGGLKATFQLESDLTTSTGSSGTGNTSNSAPAAVTGFARQSTVGLAGSFGSVRFGRSTNPIHTLLDGTDVFETQGLSTVSSPVIRSSNAVFYSTPNTLGGFYANAVYGTVDNGTSAANGSSAHTNQGLSAGYRAGPLHVGLAMHVGNSAVAGVDATNNQQAVGLTYDFGAAKVFLNASKRKTQANVGLAATVEDGETNVGVSVPLGAVTLLAGMGRNSRTAVDNTGAETGANTGSGNDWVLGAY